MKQHRWSGYPGAICLDCGVEDGMERALANGDYNPIENTWHGDTEAEYKRLYSRECTAPVRDAIRKHGEG
jgi:hypothetical protein